MIKKISLNEILNSKKEPTVEATISVEIDGKEVEGWAGSPAGTSAGKHEAVHAPKPISELIKNAQQDVVGKLSEGIETQQQLDSKLHEIDGTDNFSKMGGSISIAISMAFANAMAKANDVEVYEYLNKGQYTLPRQLGKCIGGGVHAKGKSTEIQEFLAVPLDTETFEETVRVNKELHMITGRLGKTYDKDFEGGWIINVENEDALEILCNAAEELGRKIGVGMDVAASEFFKDGKYQYKKRSRDSGEQLEYILDLIRTYKMYYVEDPFHEDDFSAHAELTAEAKDCIICGDDLFVTNSARLNEGVKLKACNSIIIKPNQAGTLTDTCETIKTAENTNYRIVPSHRSGETKDTTISHLAVAFNAPLIKTAIAKSEEYAVKVNELLRIEKKGMKLMK